MNGPVIEALPNPSHFNENITIVVKDLKSDGQYTLLSSTTHSKHGDKFHCVAHYQADSQGVIDVGKQPSIGGYYEGIKPMALVSDLRTSAKTTKHAGPVRNDGLKPVYISLKVFQDFVSPIDDDHKPKELKSLAEITIKRQAGIIPGPGKFRGRKDSIRDLELFASPPVTRSISDVAKSSNDVVKANRSRLFSTEF